MKHIHNFINLFWGKARIYFMLPHVLMLLVIMLLDIIMLVMSVAYREKMIFCHLFMQIYLQDCLQELLFA